MMLKRLIIFLILCFLLFSCSSNNESDNGAALSGQNETPVLIGLLPVPGDSQVSLSWPKAKGNVAYYNIYWGESPDNLPNKESIGPGQNTITIAGLSNGTNYYFAMDWEDADGNLSKRSVAISAQPFAPDLQAPEITSKDIEPLISVTFSEPMDTSSITIEINPSKELFFTAETPLKEGETYTIQVAGSDKAGNHTCREKEVRKMNADTHC